MSNILGTLGQLKFRQGKLAEAEDSYRQALRLAQNSSVSDTLVIVYLRRGLADVLAARNQLDEAIEQYEIALGVHDRLVGADLRWAYSTLQTLAKLYRKTRQPAKAAEMDRRMKTLPLPDTRHIHVYYATNRKRAQKKNKAGLVTFGSDDADILRLGRAVVRVPHSEVNKLASRITEGVGASDAARGQLTTASSLKLLRVRAFAKPNVFPRSIAVTSRRSALYRNQALLYVHGYNVSFKDAIRRASQIAFDLEFDGSIIAFSWPSKRGFMDYLSDTDSTDVAVDYLISLFDTLAKSLPDTRIHVIAHSMGNLVLLRALERIAERRDPGRTPKLGEIVMAHADIDGRRCRQLVRHARRIVDGITMYVNANDWALWVSQKLHGKERCGGKAQLFKGVDTIDTTGLGSGNSLRALWPGNWNHNVFAHNPLLFGEITRLLLNGKRPVHRRTPEFVKVTNRDGKAFWKYDPKLNIYEAVAKATNR